MKKILLVLALSLAALFGGDFEDAKNALKAKDYDKAISLCQSAIEKGDGRASYLLGGMYFAGSGVEKNVEKALKLWHQSADSGYIEAQVTLALVYFQSKKYKESIQLFQKPAENGDMLAQEYLGNIYQNGLGVEKDYKKAVIFYQKALAQGNIRAQNNLAYMYRDGLGVKQDYKKAIELYEKGAKEDNANAQYNLGNMYDFGEGVKKDYKKAAEFYKKAAGQGVASAQKNLEILCEESPWACK